MQNHRTLFDLLPEYYRDQDQANEGALRALSDVIAEETVRLRAAITDSYANWFPETASDASLSISLRFSGRRTRRGFP